jgi:hypothetical protein
MRGKKKRQMRSFSSSTQAMPHLVQQEALEKVQKHVQNKNKAVCEWDDELESEMVQA